MSCDLLVGSTGFVGGNLAAKHTFTAACHSSDIAAQYGTRPDLCVYAGVPYWAAISLLWHTAANVCFARRLPPTKPVDPTSRSLYMRNSPFTY